MFPFQRQPPLPHVYYSPAQNKIVKPVTYIYRENHYTGKPYPLLSRRVKSLESVLKNTTRINKNHIKHTHPENPYLWKIQEKQKNTTASLLSEIRRTYLLLYFNRGLKYGMNGDLNDNVNRYHEIVGDAPHIKYTNKSGQTKKRYAHSPRFQIIAMHALPVREKILLYQAHLPIYAGSVFVSTYAPNTTTAALLTYEHNRDNEHVTLANAFAHHALAALDWWRVESRQAMYLTLAGKTPTHSERTIARVVAPTLRSDYHLFACNTDKIPDTAHSVYDNTALRNKHTQRAQHEIYERYQERCSFPLASHLRK